MSGVVRPCRGCGDALPDTHLRTQFAQPHDKWREVRTHDLGCLLDFLEEEEDAILAARDGEVFKAAVTRSAGAGP